MSERHSFDLEPIHASEAADLLRWFLGDQAAPIRANGLRWGLAFCHGGAVWGRCADGGAWRLACDAFPEFVARPERDNLVEFRLFAPSGEAHVWSAPDGLRGRWLRSLPEGQIESWQKPIEGYYLTHGHETIESRQDFTYVRDSAGMRQVLPLMLETNARRRERPALHFTQYVTRDEASGVVRPTVARLTDLKWNGGSQ